VAFRDDLPAALRGVGEHHPHPAGLLHHPTSNGIVTRPRIMSTRCRSRPSIRVDRPRVAERGTDPEPCNYGPNLYYWTFPISREVELACFYGKYMKMKVGDAALNVATWSDGVGAKSA
jgi:hypothetical protein